METNAPQERAVSQMLQAARPFQVTGHLDGQVLLTPPAVKDFPSLFFSFPRYEHRIKFSDSKEPLSSIYSSTSISKGTGGKRELGIYSWTGLPDCCCVCLKPPTHYEVCRVNEIVTSVKFTGQMDEDTAQRIAEAWSSKRYWIPVPFCEEHSLSTCPVQITEAGGQFKISLTNREYSQMFAKQHLAPASRIDLAKALRSIGIYMLFLGAGVMITVGGMFTYFALTDPNAYLPPNALPLGIGLLVGGVLLGIVDFSGYRWNEKNSQLGIDGDTTTATV